MSDWMEERTSTDAPVWMSPEEADGFAAGWNAAVEAFKATQTKSFKRGDTVEVTGERGNKFTGIVAQTYDVPYVTVQRYDNTSHYVSIDNVEHMD